MSGQKVQTSERGHLRIPGFDDFSHRHRHHQNLGFLHKNIIGSVSQKIRMATMATKSTVHFDALDESLPMMLLIKRGHDVKDEREVLNFII